MAKNKAENMDEVTKESVQKALASMESGRPAVKNNVSPVVVHKEVREMSWDAFRAKEVLDVEEFKGAMQGIYTTCVGRNTIDESPMAYKPMEEIVENIRDTATIETVIKPIYNFKAEE